MLTENQEKKLSLILNNEFLFQEKTALLKSFQPYKTLRNFSPPQEKNANHVNFLGGKRPRPRSMGGLPEKKNNNPPIEENSDSKLIENKGLLKKIQNSEYRSISIHADLAKNVTKEIEKNKKMIESLNNEFKKINNMNQKYGQPDYSCIVDQKIAGLKNEIREIKREIQLIILEQKRFERDLNKAVPNNAFSLDLEQATLHLRKNIEVFLDNNDKRKKKIGEIQLEIKKKFDSYAIAEKEIKNVTSEAIKNKIYSVMNSEHVYNLISLKALKIEQSNAILNKSRASSESKMNKEIAKLKKELKQYDTLIAEIEQKIENQSYIIHSYKINESLQQQSICINKNDQMEIFEENRNISNLEEREKVIPTFNQVDIPNNPKNCNFDKKSDENRESTSHHDNIESSFDEKYIEEDINKKDSILSMEIKPIDKSEVFRHLQSVPDISDIQHCYKNRFSEFGQTSSLNSKVNRYNSLFENVSLKFESGTSSIQLITQNNEEVKKTKCSQKELICNVNEEENDNAKQDQIKFQSILEKQYENEDEKYKTSEKQEIGCKKKEKEENQKDNLERKKSESDEIIKTQLLIQIDSTLNDKNDENANNERKSSKNEPDLNDKKNLIPHSEAAKDSDQKEMLTWPEPLKDDLSTKKMLLKKANSSIYSKPFKIRKVNRAIIKCEPKEKKSSFTLEENQSFTNEFLNIDDFSSLKNGEERFGESKTYEYSHNNDNQTKKEENSDDNLVINEDNLLSNENQMNNQNTIQENCNEVQVHNKKSSLFDEKIEYFNINTIEKEKNIEKTESEVDYKFQEQPIKLDEQKNNAISLKSSYDLQQNELEVERTNRSQRSSGDSGKKEKLLRKNNKKMSTFSQNENYDTFEITFSGMDYDQDEKRDFQKKGEKFEIKKQLTDNGINNEEEEQVDEIKELNDEEKLEGLKPKNPDENSMISNFFENLDI